jgi:hypothetical protein
VIETVLRSHRYKKNLKIDDIFFYHNWARKEVEKIVEERK